ncbi:hypothetical protein ACFIQF_09755 [Comamonas sp. J-3]|uniref:hypothetical protein n=1 Tax=Comamonas trifloxystrobinivorans TaxID=3350256 RepID=UPI0037264D35
MALDHAALAAVPVPVGVTTQTPAAGVVCACACIAVPAKSNVGKSTRQTGLRRSRVADRKVDGGLLNGLDCCIGRPLFFVEFVIY